MGRKPDNLVGEILALEPELQVPFHPAIHFQKTDSGIALLVRPRDLALKLDRKLGPRQRKADLDRTSRRQCLMSANPNAPLTEVQEIGGNSLPSSATE